MAGKTELAGRFIAFSHSKWDDPIVSNDGRSSTPPGESVTVWVFTPHDNDVCKVKVGTVGRNADPEAMRNIIKACEGLEFGADVVADCGPLAFGAYRGIAIRPAVKRATAGAAAAG